MDHNVNRNAYDVEMGPTARRALRCERIESSRSTPVSNDGFRSPASKGGGAKAYELGEQVIHSTSVGCL